MYGHSTPIFRVNYIRILTYNKYIYIINMNRDRNKRINYPIRFISNY